MLISNNSLLSELKQKQSQLLRKQTLALQQAHQSQNFTRKMKKKLQQASPKKLPKKPNRQFSHLTSQSISQIQSMSQIQSRTKKLNNNSLYSIDDESQIPPSPKKPPLPKPVQIPVYLPQSVMRKAQKLPPPTYQKALKNGEVVTVHLLSQSIPAFDPLVKTKAHIGQQDLQEMSKQMNLPSIKDVISNIQDQMQSMAEPAVPAVQKRSSSLSPKIRKKLRLEQSFELPKQQKFPKINQKPIQKSQVFQYAYREFANPTERTPSEFTRPWVHSRMQEYSARVRQQFMPKASPKKQIQLALLNQRSNFPKLSPTKRVKLSSLFQQIHKDFFKKSVQLEEKKIF